MRLAIASPDSPAAQRVRNSAVLVSFHPFHRYMLSPSLNCSRRRTDLPACSSLDRSCNGIGALYSVGPGGIARWVPATAVLQGV